MLIKVETRYWYPITENMTNQQFIKKNYWVILSKSYMTTSYGVMVVYSPAECGKAWFWDPVRVKPKIEIGICCFFAKQAALRSKSKDWLALNQDNVFKWRDKPTCKLLLQWASTIIIISLKYKLFSPWYS